MTRALRRLGQQSHLEKQPKGFLWSPSHEAIHFPALPRRASRQPATPGIPWGTGPPGPAPPRATMGRGFGGSYEDLLFVGVYKSLSLSPAQENDDLVRLKADEIDIEQTF